MSALLDRFKQAFAEWDADSIARINDLYTEDVLFEDPFHTIRGRAALCNYFTHMYDGVIRCAFTFDREVTQGDTAALTWNMDLQHRRLRGGRPIQVVGASLLRFDDKVRSHRDFFDAGAMLYEWVPVIGTVVRSIKARI